MPMCYGNDDVMIMGPGEELQLPESASRFPYFPSGFSYFPFYDRVTIEFLASAIIYIETAGTAVSWVAFLCEGW